MSYKYAVYFALVAAWISLSAGGCERDRNGDPIELFIKNNSIDTIVASLQYNYPDSLLVDFKSTPDTYATTVAPGAEDNFWAFAGWEYEIVRRNAQSTLIMVIYSQDTLRKYTFDQIQGNYNILKKYNLSVDSLKKLNWRIIYPK
jgi:hypothetical protein